MLSNRQINKIVKKVYPSSAFPHKERKHLRQAMREELTEYLDAHPDTTYEELQEQYAGSEMPMTTQGSSAAYITKILACIGLLIAIFCAIIYSISNGWEPPTYYF